MTQDASPVHAVERFAAALREIRGRLLADLAPITDIADLLAAVRSRRELAREGVTSSGIEYTVHGAGCRMLAPDGRDADIDLVTDPTLGHDVEAFDAWRIRWFLDEADDDGYSNSEIAALRRRPGTQRRCWRAHGSVAVVAAGHRLSLANRVVVSLRVRLRSSATADSSDHPVISRHLIQRILIGRR